MKASEIISQLPDGELKDRFTALVGDHSGDFSGVQHLATIAYLITGGEDDCQFWCGVSWRFDGMGSAGCKDGDSLHGWNLADECFNEIKTKGIL